MLEYLKKSYLSAALLSALLLFCAPLPSFAQEEDANTPVEQTEQAEQAEIERPAPGPKLLALQEYMANLMRGLEPYQAEYIAKIRDEFGVIRSVQIVRSDVEGAVGTCAEKHADLSADITARFNAWKEAVVPKLSVADAALQDAIQRQGFRPTVRMNMLLDHMQDAFEERDNTFKREPLTTIEACRELLNSMDETEQNLKSLLDTAIQNLNTLSAEPDKTAVGLDENNTL